MPSTSAVRVLVALADALGDRPGWTMLGAAEAASGETMGRADVFAALPELADRGYCVQAAHGGLVYVTYPGSALARAARALVRSGVPISELTLERLANHLLPYPFRE